MEHTAHATNTMRLEVIEYVRFGIGMRLAVSAEEGALVFRDLGYVWRVAGLRIALPLGLLLGTAYVEERPDPSERRPLHDADAAAPPLVRRRVPLQRALSPAPAGPAPWGHNERTMPRRPENLYPQYHAHIYFAPATLAQAAPWSSARAAN
jgi:hypothetical protein